MVLWQGNNFTVDGREPTTAEEYYRIGLRCWHDDRYRNAATHFLGAAADVGHEAAIELLGHIDYVQGRFASAVPHLRRSSGSPRAAYYLASLHQRGCPEAGIGQSYDEAGRWYRAAARSGEPEAMLALGDLYLERLLPVTGTPAEHALEQFLAAAARDHPYGQYRAAEIYRTLYQDSERAAALYRACVDNPLTGRHALGSMMTLQSQAHLREISATTAARLQQQRRDAARPSERRDDFY
ncbi:tetratricopeptide repeat protein [Streptomyces sp. NPDC060235]|uniref:tetratricopeptide repeat protein n=1 Tax=unclassified Streptomyces TaxID=2593676 RepID=UPI00364B3C48